MATCRCWSAAAVDRVLGFLVSVCAARPLLLFSGRFGWLGAAGEAREAFVLLFFGGALFGGIVRSGAKAVSKVRSGLAWTGA